MEYSPVEQEGLALVGQAELLKVEDDASFQKAATLLRMVKAFRLRIDEITSPVIKTAHAAWRAALQQKADLEEYPKEAEKVLKASLTVYEQRVTQLRRQAEEQAAKIREEAEAAARAQQASTTKAVEKAMEEQTLALALEAEARGDTKAAERILEDPRVAVAPAPAPVVFVPPIPVPPAPKAEGLSFKDHYRAEVEDMMKLVRAIAAGQGVATVALIEPNQTALDALARTLKEEMSVPGVKLIKERKAAAKP